MTRNWKEIALAFLRLGATSYGGPAIMGIRPQGSMELLADRDPEEARNLLDLVLERMIEAVHRYEGTAARPA
ncbi:MAG: hypothetical protein HY217_10350 [Candidatus Rokubacteria bacterium]|nr:hypothetical protein [Candidatus Rokubacteria bacterium]